MEKNILQSMYTFENWASKLVQDVIFNTCSSENLIQQQQQQLF